MRVPRGIHVSPHHVAPAVDSVGGGRRSARIIDGNECKRSNQPKLRIESKSANGVDGVTQPHQETMGLFCGIGIEAHDLVARRADVPGLGRYTEREIEGQNDAVARKIAVIVASSVTQQACDDAPVRRYAVIHRHLHAQLAPTVIAEREAMHAHQQAGGRAVVMVAPDDLTGIVDMRRYQTELARVVQRCISPLLQQKTVSAYAVGYFSGVFVVDAHDIALRVNSPGLRVDGAGVIDSREFPVFEQIAVRGPRLIYVPPDYRAILIDSAGAGERGARDIE